MGPSSSFDDWSMPVSEAEAPPTVFRSSRAWRIVGVVLTAGLALAFVVFIARAFVRQTRESRRMQCASQLRQVGLAMEGYHHDHGHFPAPAMAGRDGTPLLSWRVAILPHLGYRSLYERFHLDEPWDSQHNMALLAEMPPEFACPNGPGQRSGQTGYLVVVGPSTDPTSVNTPFGPTRGVDLREITDGTSMTLLVLETNRAVPWTKPDDLIWSPDGPLPELASPHADGANVVFADGSTRFLRATIRAQVLVALLTINGNELALGGDP
jgi:prepilin-type processing-associated H-X9-DG protein